MRGLRKAIVERNIKVYSKTKKNHTPAHLGNAVLRRKEFRKAESIARERKSLRHFPNCVAPFEGRHAFHIFDHDGFWLQTPCHTQKFSKQSVPRIIAIAGTHY